MVKIRKVFQNLYFNPIDKITLGYIISTLLLIIFSLSQLENAWLHVFVRLLLIGLIVFMAWVTPRILNAFLLFLRNVYPLILLGYFYSETDYLNNIFFSNLDSFIERIELWLFGVHPSVIFSNTFPQVWFSEVMNFGYFSYYALILLLPLWLWIKRIEYYHYVTFVVILSFYLFYWFFILFPVAGPQFYLDESLRTIPHSGVFRALVLFAEWIGEGPTAAFPSSHVGIIVILTYLTYRYARELLIVYIFFGILMCFSTVYIKAHYAFDVIGGLIIAPLFIVISNWFYMRFSIKPPKIKDNFP